MSQKLIKKKHLSDQERLEIFEAFVSGVKMKEIRKQFRGCERTIRRICRGEIIQRKCYDNSKRFLLKEQDKIDILKLVKEDSSIKLEEIAKRLSTQVSIRTIERFLERAGFDCRAVTEDSTNLVSADDEKNRGSFLRSQIAWNEVEWKQTVFTDECAFSLNVVNYNLKCKKEITVNVFALVSWHYSAIYPVSNKFEADDLNDLLSAGGVLDSLKLKIPEPINFLPSNCKLYMVRPIRDLLDSRGFTLVENYPVFCSGVNAIETLWKILNEKVTTAMAKEDPENDQELFALIKRCFQTISQETIQSFIMDKIAPDKITPDKDEDSLPPKADSMPETNTSLNVLNAHMEGNHLDVSS